MGIRPTSVEATRVTAAPSGAVKSAEGGSSTCSRTQSIPSWRPGHSPGHFRIELRSQGSRRLRRRHPALTDPGSPHGNGARACAGTNARRRLRGVNCLNSARRRMHFCCPATSRRRTSRGSNEPEGHSPSTSDGSGMLAFGLAALAFACSAAAARPLEASRSPPK
jgi:hypothetical protein